MAEINLGAIKFNWKGAYNNSTAYVVDDVVSSGGSSYVCILASTGNAVSNGTYWQVMAEGGDVATTLTTQGDILYRDGSGLQRLGAGTSGQALITNGASANPSWGTISSGNYSVHAFDEYSYAVQVTTTSQSSYFDIAGGNTVNFTPTSTDDYILFSHHMMFNLNCSGAQGIDAYLIMKAGSASIGSGDTRLNYSGTHAHYLGNNFDFYDNVSKTFVMPCTGLSVGTTYYVEQAGATHNSLGNTIFNSRPSGYTPDRGVSNVNLIHYKKN